MTLDAHATPRDLPPSQPRAEVIGYADDGQGREALIVAIDGRPARPDGSLFHITWSLDRARGRRPLESHAVLTRSPWRPLAAPIAIDLVPARS
jgi:hypothetical protein